MLFCKDSDLFSLYETDYNKIMYFYENRIIKRWERNKIPFPQSVSSDFQIKVCRDDRQIFLEQEHLLSPVHQHAGEIAHKHNP